MTGKDAMLNPFCRALTGLVGLVMLAVSLTIASPTALAQNSLADALRQQSEFLPVREAYQLDGAVTREGQLRLYWRIAEGYYLYQHAFKVVAKGTPDSLLSFLRWKSSLFSRTERILTNFLSTRISTSGIFSLIL